MIEKILIMIILLMLTTIVVIQNAFLFGEVACHSGNLYYQDSKDPHLHRSFGDNRICENFNIEDLHSTVKFKQEKQ